MSTPDGQLQLSPAGIQMSTGRGVRSCHTSVHLRRTQLPCSWYTDKCPPLVDGLSATHIQMSTQCGHRHIIVNLLCKPKGPKICAICHIDKMDHIWYDIMGKSKFDAPGQRLPGKKRPGKKGSVTPIPLQHCFSVILTHTHILTIQSVTNDNV